MTPVLNLPANRTAVQRFGAIAAAILFAVTALMLTTSASASAATSCSGTLIDSKPIKSSGHAAEGTLDVYYNSSTGKNCAKATNGTGVRHYMSLWISRCAPNTGSTYANCDQTDGLSQGINLDQGDYISYAGPINTKGSASDVCIAVGVIMEIGDRVPSAYIGGHCG